MAVLVNPADIGPQVGEVKAAAPRLGIDLRYLEARGSAELERAFADMVRERCDALLVAGTSTFLVHRDRLAALALGARLPTMFNFREMVEAGGLMAYAVNMADFVGRAAVYVDRILKGARPADLPIEQPTRFELVINLKIAKALGLPIPATLLSRADEVIQSPTANRRVRSHPIRLANHRAKIPRPAEISGLKISGQWRGGDRGSESSDGGVRSFDRPPTASTPASPSRERASSGGSAIWSEARARFAEGNDNIRSEARASPPMD